MYTHYTCYKKTHTDGQKNLCIRFVLGNEGEEKEEKGIERAKKREEI